MDLDRISYPTAFLVSDCDEIYLSGWGGGANAFHGGGDTRGLPVTMDAFQGDTDGSDFYLMVLEQEAADLKYASFFGSQRVNEHVDGGTSPL